MPFIGFNPPSHTHDVIAFIHKLVAKGLSEAITVADEVVFGSFLFKEQAETVTVSEELIGTIIKTRILTENIQASIEDFVPGDFVLTDFYTYTGLSKQVIKARVPPTETISISELLARIAAKARALTQTITITDDPGGFGKVVIKALSETIASSSTLTRMTAKIKSLAELIAVIPPSYYDTFPSTYTLTTDGQISGDGKWRMPYHGQNPQNGSDLGQAGVRAPTGGMFTNVMYEYPYSITNTGSSTSATLVLNESTYYYNFDVTLYVRTISQKKSTPNPWESGWFMFHFNEAQGTNFHHYYVALKTTGLEFGRKDRSDMVDAQSFLFTNSDAHTLGTWYKLRVRAIANHFTIWVDDVQKVDITDDGSLTDFQGPIPAPSIYQYSGLFGFYNEDAEVEFSPLLITLPEVSYLRIKPRALTNTISVSEALAKILLKVRTLAESLTSSDDLTLGGRVEKFLTETVASSEAIAMVRNKARAIAQTITSSELLTIPQRVKARTLAESIAISEILSRGSPKFKDLAETITSSETAAIVRSKARTITESITSSETAIRIRATVRALAESISSSETLTRITTKTRALTEAISIFDVLVFPRTVVRTVAQSVSVSDLLTYGREVQQVLAEVITILDSLVRISTKSRSLAETVTNDDEASKVKTYSPEDTGGAGGVPLSRWEWDLNDAGVYHRTRKNVIGQKKTGGNR